jgi:hypothetical protein
MQMEANPEEMMGMADGGITSMDIDPRMFNFKDGGIVTFANPEKEKKQQVKDENKDKRTTALGDALRALIAPIVSGVQATTDYGRIRNERDAARPGLLELLTENEKAERAAQVSGLNRELAQVGSGDTLPLSPPVSPEEIQKQNEQARLRASHDLARRTGNASDSTNLNAPVISPAFQKILDARQPAPKPPMGGINNGKTPVPGANIPAIGAGTPQAIPENKFLTATEGFINQKPEVFNEATETAKLNARNEAAGIGTYAKVMREQQQQLRDQFERSRPTMNEGIVGALRAYARPGARAGDVGGEITGQMRDDREARMQFAQDQFKVTEAIEKLEEARRTGNVDKIAAAEAAVRKANADLRNHQMTAAASAANTQGRSIESAADRAQQLQIENAKLQVKKAELAQMGKDSDIAKIMKEVEALEKAGKPDDALKKLELWGKANALKIGAARYEGKGTAATPDQISKAITARLRAVNGMDILDLKSKDPAKRAKAEANIQATKDSVLKEMQGAAGGGGGGGAKPTLEEFMAKAKPANPNTPDAELKAYYQKNYGG